MFLNPKMRKFKYIDKNGHKTFQTDTSFIMKRLENVF